MLTVVHALQFHVVRLNVNKSKFVFSYTTMNFFPFVKYRQQSSCLRDQGLSALEFIFKRFGLETNCFSG